MALGLFLPNLGPVKKSVWLVAVFWVLFFSFPSAGNTGVHEDLKNPSVLQ